MAEFLVRPLLSAVTNKASSYLVYQYKVMEGMEQQRKALERMLPLILSVIQDTEEKRSKKPELSAWLDELKKVSYEAIDVFDEFKYEALRREAKKKGHDATLGKGIVSLFPHRNPIVFRYRMEMDYSGLIKQQQETPKQWRQTDSIMVDTEKDIISRSRDEEQKKIIKMLLDEARGKDLTVLPIVGMGGLGKTTFAQLIYNDPEIEKYFPLRRWCCVSDVFDVVTIANSICMSTERDREKALQDLQKEVGGKKYLIVLDHVWNRDSDKWGKLKTCFKKGGMGSVVLTTTRNAEVARIMVIGEVPVHNLEKLGEAYLMEIIQSKAFSLSKKSDEHFEVLRKIVQRCDGSPLAAQSFGSVLFNRTTLQEWKDILAKSNICNEGEDIIFPILRLSYDDLPLHIKRCFAFCAIFPKDFEIDMETLINLWLAHDLIPLQEDDNIEMVAKHIFNELVWRSFFQDVQKFPLQTTCKIHDLMHDIAQSAMGEECVSIVGRSDYRSKSLEHPRYHFYSLDDDNTILLDDFMRKQSSTLRTLLFDRDYIHISTSLLSKSSSLRALRLRYLNTESLPIRPRHLLHLRYLDISRNYHVKVLPEDICTLYNLQTLILSDCKILVGLPKDMKYMTSLRHLYTNGCLRLKCMPPELGQLTSIRTLTYFVVGASMMMKKRYIPFSMKWISEPSQTVLRLFIDLEMWLMMMMTMDLHKLFFGPLTDDDALHKLFFGPSLIDDDHDDKLRHGDDEVTMKASSNGELVMMKANSDRELVVTLRELHSLNLCGELELRGLENVSQEDAKAANLRNKEKLARLSLVWNSECCVEEPNCNGKVLDALKPHHGLLMLNVISYKSTHFSSMDDRSKYTAKLGGAQIRGLLDKLQTLCCKEVRQGKEQTFHLLQNVVIKSCPKFLTLIPDMASVTFSSLKKIKLHDLEALERWVATGGRQENEPVFPLLEKVEIEKCPKLQTLCCEMAFTPFPALKKIKLYDLEGLERLVENESTFPLLEKADIRNCPKLRSLPEAPKLKIFTLNENKAELSLFLLQSSYMSLLSKPVTCPHYPSRGVVLTKDNLIKRKWQGNKNCCFCCNDETIRHLFFECRFALSVWSIIQAASGLPPPHCVAHIFHYLKKSKLILDVDDKEGRVQLDQIHESSLSELDLKHCNFFFPTSPSQPIIMFWKCLRQLVCLEIWFCGVLIYWPEEEFLCLVSLKTLGIEGCDKLIGRPTLVKGEPPCCARDQLLPRLTSLEISNCDSLRELFVLPPSLTYVYNQRCASMLLNKKAHENQKHRSTPCSKLEFIWGKGDIVSESVQVDHHNTFTSSKHPIIVRAQACQSNRHQQQTILCHA
uniref:NB-ARC domain-containing protein n=1 Tax=Oryza nivara TaxID=4536 RepID=A0A0E0J423_ORYNI